MKNNRLYLNQSYYTIYDYAVLLANSYGIGIVNESGERTQQFNKLKNLIKKNILKNKKISAIDEDVNKKVYKRNDIEKICDDSFLNSIYNIFKERENRNVPIQGISHFTVLNLNLYTISQLTIILTNDFSIEIYDIDVENGEYNTRNSNFKNIADFLRRILTNCKRVFCSTSNRKEDIYPNYGDYGMRYYLNVENKHKGNTLIMALESNQIDYIKSLRDEVNRKYTKATEDRKYTNNTITIEQESPITFENVPITEISNYQTPAYETNMQEIIKRFNEKRLEIVIHVLSEKLGVEIDEDKLMYDIELTDTIYEDSMSIAQENALRRLSKIESYYTIHKEKSK